MRHRERPIDKAARSKAIPGRFANVLSLDPRNRLFPRAHSPHIAAMEQLIREIEAYASQMQRPPQWVLRKAFNAGWGQWDSWKSGKSSPTMAVVDRIKLFMKNNPPPETAAQQDVA